MVTFGTNQASTIDSMLLPNNNQESDYQRLDANDSSADLANDSDAQNRDETVPDAVVNRVNFEIGLQSTLVGIAGAFVVYLYHPVISNSSNYVCGDWRTLRENKHYLDELSFYDLKASWAIGVLPAILIQIYNLVEYSLSSQWSERVFQSPVFKYPVFSQVSSFRAAIIRQSWHQILPDKTERLHWQQRWQMCRQDHMLRITACLLVTFPVVLGLVFKQDWARQPSVFTTIFNEAPESSPNDLSGWVERFFPELVSLKIINNLLPASVCWIAILLQYVVLKGVQALHVVSNGATALSQQKSYLWRGIDQASVTAIIAALWSLPFVTLYWLLMPIKGGGVEAYLAELVHEESHKDLFSVSLGYLSQSSRISHPYHGYCFNGGNNHTVPLTNVTDICVEGFNFTEYVDTKRYKYILDAMWGNVKMSYPWSASFDLTGIDPLGELISFVKDVSRDQIGVFPFENVGELTLLEEFIIYPVACLTMYLSALWFSVETKCRSHSAVMEWTEQRLLPLYRSMWNVIEVYKMPFFVILFTVFVMASNNLRNDDQSFDLHAQAINFWSAFEKLLPHALLLDPDYKHAAGFEVICINVWFIADLALVFWSFAAGYHFLTAKKDEQTVPNPITSSNNAALNSEQNPLNRIESHEMSPDGLSDARTTRDDSSCSENMKELVCRFFGCHDKVDDDLDQSLLDRSVSTISNSSLEGIIVAPK